MAPEDIDAISPDESETKKAELDTEEISTSVPKEAQKVELDLDDAPFLEEDEEEEEEEAEPEAVALDEGEDKEPWYRQRKIIIAAASAFVLLVLLGVGYFVFIAGDNAADVADTASESETAAGEGALEESLAPQEPAEIIISMKPFWIEQVDAQGEVRFLVCQFAAVTTNEELSQELNQKNTVLRDAIFYYLKNKDLTYLSDKENVETLKEDLLSVINQYLSVARLETLLIEQYMVK